jgi:hypothetical protein
MDSQSADHSAYELDLDWEQDYRLVQWKEMELVQMFHLEQEMEPPKGWDSGRESQSERLRRHHSAAKTEQGEDLFQLHRERKRMGLQEEVTKQQRISC